MREPQHLIGPVPGPQLRGSVPAEDEEHLRVRVRAAQRQERVERVRRSRSLQLDVRDGESWIARGGEAAHLEALLARRHRAGPVRRRAGGHEDDLVQVGAFDGGLGGGQMAEVDRVEGATQHAQLHGWYSNSVGPIRTVSPAFTPADSRAALTPMRSSSTWNPSRALSESRSVRSTRRSI